MAERKRRTTKNPDEEIRKRINRNAAIFVVSLAVVIGLSISLFKLHSRYIYARDLQSASERLHEELLIDVDRLERTLDDLSTEAGERQLIRENLHAPDPGEELIIIIPSEEEEGVPGHSNAIDPEEEIGLENEEPEGSTQE